MKSSISAFGDNPRTRMLVVVDSETSAMDAGGKDDEPKGIGSFETKRIALEKPSIDRSAAQVSSSQTLQQEQHPPSDDEETSSLLSSDEYSYADYTEEDDAKQPSGFPVGGKRPISPSSNNGEGAVRPTSPQRRSMIGLATCVDCGAENHRPVQNCNLVGNWIRKRQQLPTFPGDATVQFVMDSIVAEVAQQRNNQGNEPIDICDLYGWDVTRLRQLRANAAPERVHANNVVGLAAANQGFANPDNVGHINFQLAGRLRFNAQLPADLDAMNDMHDDEISIEEELLPRNNAERTFSCHICMEDTLNDRQVYSLACGDMFCRDCWQGYLHQALETTPTAPIPCPQLGCAMRVTESAVQSVTPGVLSLYRSRRRDFFVSKQLGIRWCPGPDCDRVAFHPGNLFEDQAGTFCFLCSGCGTTFCFGCGNGPHEGACDLVEDVPAEIPEYDAQEANELFTTRDDHRRKQCPLCSAMIEKTGGCNRMTCRCGHAFCWLCLGNYVDYGSHQCWAFNRNPEPSDEVNFEFLRRAISNRQGIPWSHQLQQVSDEVVELDRFAFYYNRFAVHDLGQHFAEGLCPCLQHRANAYSSVNTLRGGTDGDFFVLANETLVMSRRLLKYAYCSAYHSQRRNEEDVANSHLGFLSLNRLERFTEELSDVSENALTRHDRARVLNLIDAVKKTMGAVDDFEDLETLHRHR